MRDAASGAQERAGLVPRAVDILDTDIHHDLSVFGLGNAHPIHRTWCRTFEVNAILIVAAAMARALELGLRCQPARRTSKVRTLREDGVEALLRPHDPHTEVFLEALAHFTDRIVTGESRLEGRRGREQDAREGGAHGSQQRDRREDPEAAPTQAAEKIASGPQAAELRAFALALGAFLRLLLAAALFKRCKFVGGLLLLCFRHAVAPRLLSCERAASSRLPTRSSQQQQQTW